jgi:hypothetical protein
LTLRQACQFDFSRRAKSDGQELTLATLNRKHAKLEEHPVVWNFAYSQNIFRLLTPKNHTEDTPPVDVTLQYVFQRMEYLSPFEAFQNDVFGSATYDAVKMNTYIISRISEIRGAVQMSDMIDCACKLFIKEMERREDGGKAQRNQAKRIKVTPNPNKKTLLIVKKETISSVLDRLSKICTGMLLAIKNKGDTLNDMTILDLWQNVQDVLVVGNYYEPPPLFVVQNFDELQPAPPC